MKVTRLLGIHTSQSFSTLRNNTACSVTDKAHIRRVTCAVDMKNECRWGLSSFIKVYFTALSVGVVCMDNYLYAVGGYDGQTQLKTMERYNVSRDVWEPMASMNHCRSAHGVTVYQCKIYVLGELEEIKCIP